MTAVLILSIGFLFIGLYLLTEDMGGFDDQR